MDTFEIIKLVIGSGGILGIGILVFKAGGFAKGIKSNGEKLDAISNKLERMEISISSLDSRVSHIEGYLMGRDYRNGTEK